MYARQDQLCKQQTIFKVFKFSRRCAMTSLLNWGSHEQYGKMRKRSKYAIAEKHPFVSMNVVRSKNDQLYSMTFEIIAPF